MTAGLLLVLWALVGPVPSPKEKPEASSPDSGKGPSRALALFVLGGICAILLGAVAWPYQNGVALTITCLMGAALPSMWFQRRRQAHRDRVNAAMGQAIIHLSTVAHTYRVPYQALQAAVEAFPPVIREQYRRAIRAQEVNVPLPEALREAARQLDDNFYAHQVAELADVSMRTGADFVGALVRLSQRFSLLEEVRAEEKTATSGYISFTRVFALAALAPLFWWTLTRSPSVEYFISSGFARVLLAWAVLASALCSFLPDLLSVEEV